MRTFKIILAAILVLVAHTTTTMTKDSLHTETKYQFVSTQLNKQNQRRNIEEMQQEIRAQHVYDSIYEKTIEFMKKNEGFRSEPYYCMAGVKTVGYGHVIKEKDSLQFPLSKYSADALLRSDLNKRIRWVEDDLDMDRLEEPAKVIALAHFIFNVGQGNFKNSRLYDRLKNHGELSDVIMHFVHIKTKNGWVKSKNLLQMRKYEYSLYHGKTLV